MPSDPDFSAEHADACKQHLGAARESFHSALAHTIEEVRTFLDLRETSEEDQVAGTGAALGAFASGRIDPERFSALVSHDLAIDESDAERLEKAFDVLRALNARFDGLLDVRVPPGGSLRDVVAERLAEVGRAFGAAHVVTAVRAGNYDEASHAGFLDAYPFAKWSAAERALAPALYVEVEGADCRAAALSEFLDGRLRIVLATAGPCPVAPLARLVAPRTFVLQTNDPATLGPFVAHEGAGIAALVPEGAARFQHVPAPSGKTTCGLEIGYLPEGKLRPVGGISTAQQGEDLLLLGRHDHAEGHASGDGSEAEAPKDVAGQLANWLLQQADLESVG